MSKEGMPVPPTRADLRSRTLGKAREFKSQMVDIDGTQYEVRQPSVRERSAILQAGEVLSGDAKKMDMGRMQVQGIITCTYVPGSGERVFEQADFEALMEQPSGGFVDKLGEVVLTLMNIEAEKAAKN